MLSRMLTANQIARFWASATCGEGCWVWHRLRAPSGYGSFSFGQTHWRAHRMAWLLTYGPIPRGLWVLHRCDNRPCIRPDHLFLGTVHDNVADMVRKGRQARGERHAFVIHPERRPYGERHGSAKLTSEQVDTVRARYRSGLATQRELAAEFGVSHFTINHIVRNRIWRDAAVEPTHGLKHPRHWRSCPVCGQDAMMTTRQVMCSRQCQDRARQRRAAAEEA
jgi:hypothetical protein